MKTLALRVYGIVQGVGFRPTVSRHATACGVKGSVCNKGPYVEIFVQGTEQQTEAFLDALEHKPPRRAAILKIDKKTIDLPACTDFRIIESAKTAGEIFISPDIAICEECKQELYNPSDRRYLHPFINCTCCGPRLTILDALPYDRERTSMKEFPMCPDCSEEYHNPATRRYDAQPVCCHQCGPEVYLLGRSERGREAITYARQTILRGGIVAVKGIGGFHLCCDATNEAAVELLRERKHRPHKPFAVMLRNEKIAQRECIVEDYQLDVLTGHQKPIILLERRAESTLAAAVAPGNPKIGVMLPYAPVQLLLFAYDDGLTMPDALVMTSGNISGAPICRDDAEALKELSSFTDCILSHNRMIRIRADDSVMDFFRGKPYMIRRSRGYAPLPYMLSKGGTQKVLALGGELKNTFCLGIKNLLYPSPYVGDLADVRTVRALEETVQRFQTLLEVKPELVVCDLHPRYNSTTLAEQLGLPVLKVQHHYAHILACMAENDWTEPVIGVSFDGTGYGTDGTIWGGELLLADTQGFTRAGHVVPFWQIGGDASAREGWRIAVALLGSLYQDKGQALALIKKLELCTEPLAKLQLTLLERRLQAVPSTSAGRLFDGVSAILGLCTASSFEGEAAMTLEFAAEAWAKKQEIHQQNLELSVETNNAEQAVVSDAVHASAPTELAAGRQQELIRQEGGELLLATDTLVRKLVEQRLAGVAVGKLAYEFHAGLAQQIAAGCEELRQQSGRNVVALSGGCYQNQLLLQLSVELLEAKGFKVLLHSLVPPNDGGIALGQAAYGIWQQRCCDSKNTVN